MPNPYINKIVYGNRVLLDLTSDTITSDKLAAGVTAHTASGESVTGTAVITVEDDVLVVPSGFGMSIEG